MGRTRKERIMDIETLILDARDSYEHDMGSACESATVELDGKEYSGSCTIYAKGFISVWLTPLEPKEIPLGDVMVKGKDTYFRFEDPPGTKTLGQVLINTGRMVIK